VKRNRSNGIFPIKIYQTPPIIQFSVKQSKILSAKGAMGRIAVHQSSSTTLTLIGSLTDVMEIRNSLAKCCIHFVSKDNITSPQYGAIWMKETKASCPSMW
jgi:hypothetical protein